MAPSTPSLAYAALTPPHVPLVRQAHQIARLSLKRPNWSKRGILRARRAANRAKRGRQREKMVEMCEKMLVMRKSPRATRGGADSSQSTMAMKLAAHSASKRA